MNDRIHLDQMLVAYVDGELDGESTAEVETRIAADPHVRSDIEMYRATAMLLRAACGEQHYATAPERRPSPQPKRSPWTAARGWAIAASVVLAAGCFGAGAFWRSWSADPLMDEVAEYHAVISRETTRLAELPPERADDLVSWLGQRLGRHLVVPDLGDAGLRFAGGRMLVIDGAPVADFLYTRDHAAPVAICVLRGEYERPTLHIVEREGLHLATWSGGGYTYVVVGDLDASAAKHLADIVAFQFAG
jgi:anti-sigma factor RsiW